MYRPTWNNFIGKNFDDNRYAMEALARLLFRTRYGLGDSLPYFKNHAGNETEPIVVDNGEIVGFQSKYFENGKIDADQIYDSLEIVTKRYPKQNRYIIYTNGEFGNPPKGKDKTQIKYDFKGIIRTSRISKRRGFQSFCGMFSSN